MVVWYYSRSVGHSRWKNNLFRMSTNCKSNILTLCCICLCKKSDLLQLSCSKQPNSETWFSKLVSCLVEIKWSKEHHICLICSNQLDFVYNFRRLCLESQEQREKMLYTGSNGEGSELITHVRDFSETSSIKPKIELPNINTYICKKCSMEFTTIDELDKHFTKLHTKEEATDTEDIIDDLSDNESNSSSDSWTPLTKRLQTRQALKMKRSSKSKQNSAPKQFSKPNTKKPMVSDVVLKCYTCEETFNTIIKLVKHSRVEHNIARKDVKPYSCDKCDRRFTIPCKLKVHMMYHDGIRNEICSNCGKGFPTKKALHVHEQIHQDREYQCSYCPKKFNTKGNRRGHERTVHLDPSKWFACHICNKKFNKKDNLIGHIRRHTNEKPFACQVCEMRFCSSTDLRMHSKTHSNVRQYKCPECDKDYKYRNQLNYHLTRTHNIYR